MAPKTPEEAFFEGLGAEKKKSATEVKAAPEEDKAAYQALRPVTKSNLFSHPEAHPFVLDMALIKAFQVEWFTWESETLFKEIELVFSTSIADINKVKILAAMTLHVTDVFWDKWEIFEKVIAAFNGIIPRPNYMQPPDISSLMAGIDIANSIRNEEFDEEIGRYVAACFLFDEVSYAPPPLDFCQIYLSQPKYRCKHCSNTGSALPPFDGHCDSCSQKFEDEHPFNFRPAEGAKDDPKDVEYYFKLDHRPTEERFKHLISLPYDQVKIEETPEDVESAKLIAATDYMVFRQGQRDKQIQEIKDWMTSQ
jgi:hypothetical protein